MKAVILAAGRGTRMHALTSSRPKPMLEIAGKPLLEHVLTRLRAAGFSSALVVTGFLGKVVEDHFAGYPMDLRFRRQDPIDGTAHAALLAREFTAGDKFLLTFADILADPNDYRAMWELAETPDPCEAVIGVKRVDDPWQGAAVYERDGRVIRIVEKPPRGASQTDWNSAGLYVFRPSLFAELERVPPSPRGEFELTSAVAQLIEAGRLLRLYVVRGEWRDVGRPEDLQAAAEIVAGAGPASASTK